MKIKQEKYIKRDGFTIVEIMVIVMIIGVLTSIAVVSITKVRQNARLRLATADLEMLVAAVRHLAWDTGKWPTGVPRTDQAGLEIQDLTTADAGLLENDGTYGANWKGPYLEKIPNDPWGSKYFFDADYRVDGVDRIVIGSYGPNKTGFNRYNEDNLYVVIE